MIYVNVISNTTHCKKNQTSVKVIIGKRVFKYITYMHPVVAACALTVVSLVLYPFPANTKPVVL